MRSRQPARPSVARSHLLRRFRRAGLRNTPIGAGLALALGLDVAFMITAHALDIAPRASIAAPAEGMLAILAGNVAAFAGAGGTALVTAYGQKQFMARNAYVVWASASLILMLNAA